MSNNSNATTSDRPASAPYIVSISFHAERAIADDVKSLISRVLYPMACGRPHVTEPLLCEIVGEHNPETCSFAFQFRTDDPANISPWVEGEVAKFLQILNNRYGSRLLHFITTMKILLPEK